MKKYFVYSGFASPDNCADDGGPVCIITECQSESQVLQLKKSFDAAIHDECSCIIFRVFHGEEKQLIPKTKVVEYELTNL